MSICSSVAVAILVTLPAAAQDQVVIPLGTLAGWGDIHSGVLSPDEKSLAFLYFSHLRVVSLQTKQVSEVRSDFRDDQIFYFSPDSSKIEFKASKWLSVDKWQDGRLLLAGAFQDLRSPEGGPRLFSRPAPGGESVIGLIDENGSNERVIANGRHWPYPWWEWAPDGSALMLMIWRGNHRQEVHHLLAVDPRTGKSKELASGSGEIGSPLWRWNDGLYFIRPDKHAPWFSSGEIWRYPVSGGSAVQITRGTEGYSRLMAYTRDGLLLAVRYRLRGDFWDGLLGMLGMGYRTGERDAELVLVRLGK